MEPGTKKQLERKILIHQEIKNTQSVLRLTGNQYKPSTLKVIARFQIVLQELGSCYKNGNCKRNRHWVLTLGGMASP